MKKFSDIVSKDKVSGFETAARQDMANRAWLDKSFEIALRILARLKELDWTQAKLAEEMNVSPQYVSKIVKGRENLTLETIALIETALAILLITVESPLYHGIRARVFSSALVINRSEYKPIASAKQAEERTSYTSGNNHSNNLEIAA